MKNHSEKNPIRRRNHYEWQVGVKLTTATMEQMGEREKRTNQRPTGAMNGTQSRTSITLPGRKQMRRIWWWKCEIISMVESNERICGPIPRSTMKGKKRLSVKNVERSCVGRTTECTPRDVLQGKYAAVAHVECVHCHRWPDQGKAQQSKSLLGIKCLNPSQEMLAFSRWVTSFAVARPAHCTLFWLMFKHGYIHCN